MRTTLIAVVSAVLAAGCSPPDIVEVSVDDFHLEHLDFQSQFGWGTLAPGQSSSSTVGSPLASPDIPRCCVTEKLPAGIDFDCESPVPGAITMTVRNRTGAPIFVGVRWHGAHFY